MKFDGHPSKITVPKNGHLELIAILLLLVFRSAPVNREPVEVTIGGVFRRVFPGELFPKEWWDTPESLPVNMLNKVISSKIP